MPPSLRTISGCNSSMSVPRHPRHHDLACPSGAASSLASLPTRDASAMAIAVFRAMGMRAAAAGARVDVRQRGPGSAAGEGCWLASLVAAGTSPPQLRRPAGRSSASWRPKWYFCGTGRKKVSNRSFHGKSQFFQTLPFLLNFSPPPPLLPQFSQKQLKRESRHEIQSSDKSQDTLQLARSAPWPQSQHYFPCVVICQAHSVKGTSGAAG